MSEKHKNQRKAPLVLVVMSGPSQGLRINLDCSLLMGRDPDAKLFLDDERISRHHAIVEMDGEKPVLRDLGSKNGTFVNGREIKEPIILRTNDRVRLGKTLLGVVPGEGEKQLTPEPLETDSTSISRMSPSGFREIRRDTPPPGTGEIDRRILRSAADAATSVVVLSQKTQDTDKLLQYLIRTLRAESGAFFIKGRGPVSLHGVGTFYDPVAEDISFHLDSTDRSSFLLAGENSLFDDSNQCVEGEFLSMFLKVGDHGDALLVLYRGQTKNFNDGDLQFADALSECLRIVPLEPFFKIFFEDPSRDYMARVIGSSSGIAAVREKIVEFSRHDAPVLILGEPGIEIEIFARAVAQLSDRAEGPYLEVSATCIMPDQLESEIFGHESGALPNIYGQKTGKLELADGGTLFIDELGELPIDVQTKLTHYLDGKSVTRLGGDEELTCSTRIVFASNQDLDYLVETGALRPDLLRKLRGNSMEIPALRDRREDIPELVDHILQELRRELGRRLQVRVSGKVLKKLLSYDWPGNMRELRSILQRMIVLSEADVLDIDHLPREIADQRDSTTMKLPRLQMLTEMIEREEISKALMEAGGHKSNAAKALGISRPTLDKKIKMYGLGAMVHQRPRESSGAGLNTD